MVPDPRGDGTDERRIEELSHLCNLFRHDVREDVSLVVGRAEELRDDEEPSVTRPLEEVVTASNHLLQLAGAVGDVAEAICGGEPPERRPVDLARILRTEVETARSLYAEANLELRTDEDEIEVLADSLLSAVLASLIGDAVRYSDRKNPEVVVSVETDGATATVRVADDGPGVPEYRRSELFRARADGSSGGTRVGRYLVGRLVDRYGGEVGVENRGERGATTAVTLSLA